MVASDRDSGSARRVRALAMRSIAPAALWKGSDSRTAASWSSVQAWIWQRSSAEIDGLVRSSRSSLVRWVGSCWFAGALLLLLVLFLLFLLFLLYMGGLSHTRRSAQGGSGGGRGYCAQGWVLERGKRTDWDVWRILGLDSRDIWWETCLALRVKAGHPGVRL